MSLAALGNGVAAVAAACLLFPGTALAVDLPAPVADAVEALPAELPALAPAVPAAAPVAEPVSAAVAPVIAAVQPAASPATAPTSKDSPQLDASPASRAPARATTPQRRTERTARAAAARPVREPAVDEPAVAAASAPQVVETEAAASARRVREPLPTPELPFAPAASTAAASGLVGGALALLALLVGMFLFALPELGARAPLAPLLRRRFSLFSLLERPG